LWILSINHHSDNSNHRNRSNYDGPEHLRLRGLFLFLESFQDSDDDEEHSNTNTGTLIIRSTSNFDHGLVAPPPTRTKEADHASQSRNSRPATRQTADFAP
jgi:hypothetical protein